MPIEKYNKLKQILLQTGKCAIAVSGGLDSMFLALTAKQVLGDDFLAINISTPYMHKSEREEMENTFHNHGVNYKILELAIPKNIRNNPEDRCYLCKSQLFTEAKKLAIKQGFKVIMDGTNADDVHTHRPGMLALAELNVLSPLKDSGFTKAEIRELSKKLEYPFHNKDSNSCLLTRLPYFDIINEKELQIIEKAEAHLQGLGYRQIRVRSKSLECNIEVSPNQVKQLQMFFSNQNGRNYFISLGFKKITIDNIGYIAGRKI